jgi:hypothetical protein
MHGTQARSMRIDWNIAGIIGALLTGLLKIHSPRQLARPLQVFMRSPGPLSGARQAMRRSNDACRNQASAPEGRLLRRLRRQEV